MKYKSFTLSKRLKKDCINTNSQSLASILTTSSDLTDYIMTSTYIDDDQNYQNTESITCYIMYKNIYVKVSENFLLEFTMLYAHVRQLTTRHTKSREIHIYLTTSEPDPISHCTKLSKTCIVRGGGTMLKIRLSH